MLRSPILLHYFLKARPRLLFLFLTYVHKMPLSHSFLQSPHRTLWACGCWDALWWPLLPHGDVQQLCTMVVQSKNFLPPGLILTAYRHQEIISAVKIYSLKQGFKGKVASKWRQEQLQASQKAPVKKWPERPPHPPPWLSSMKHESHSSNLLLNHHCQGSCSLFWLPAVLHNFHNNSMFP